MMTANITNTFTSNNKDKLPIRQWVWFGLWFGFIIIWFLERKAAVYVCRVSFYVFDSTVKTPTS